MRRMEVLSTGRAGVFLAMTTGKCGIGSVNETLQVKKKMNYSISSGPKISQRVTWAPLVFGQPRFIGAVYEKENNGA